MLKIFSTCFLFYCLSYCIKINAVHTRIKYMPQFDIDELPKPSFVSSPYVLHFFKNGNYANGGMADWDVNGLGLLYVYCENLNDPVLVVPLNLGATLKLNRGRAWVGFTAATGLNTWQVHDILDWTFTSLRMDSFYSAPVVVNGHGAHSATA